MDLRDIFGDGSSPFGPAPDHPDFFRLTEIGLRINSLAAEDKEQSKLDELLIEMVDRASLMQISYESAMKMLNNLAANPNADLEDPRDLLAALMTVFVSGFVIGHEFRERKQ